MGITKSAKKGIDLTSDAIRKSIDKVRESVLDVALYLVVGGIAGAIAWVAGAALALITYFVLGPQLGWDWAIAPAAAIGLAGGIVGCSLLLAAHFGAIEYAFYGKKTGYFESGNLGTAFRWVLFIVGVLALAALLAGAVAALLASSKILLATALVAMYVLAIICAICIGFALYYSGMELAINKRGPIDTIRVSYALLRENFWETITFALLTGMLFHIIQSVPTTILVFMLQAILLLSSMNPLVIGGVAIPAALLLVVWIVLGAAELIVKVEFYKKIAGTGMK